MTLTDLELELIECIKDSPLGAHLRKVDTLPDLQGAEMVRRWGAEAPAVYVAWERGSQNGDTLELEFSLGAVAKHAGGPRQARHGDSTAIGLYSLVHGLIGLFQGRATPNVAWQLRGSFVPLVTAALTDAGLSAAALSVGCRISVEPLEPENLGDFVTFHVDYDVEPHEAPAEHGKWLAEPPDHTTSAPDTSDTVELEQ